ncbi:MAG: hypothetical protein HQL71_05820 [Magnetococcales bacterium]|nr:hypothetical protein [Magnetococcales bacterium]
MVNFLASAGFIAVLVLSLYGWGKFALNKLMPNSSFGCAFNATFGISVCIFLGGWLNLLAIAKPTALWGFIIFGLFFSIYGLKYKQLINNIGISFSLAALKNQPDKLWQGFLYFSLLALIVFYINTLMPASIFNPYNDFWINLPRPLQMLGSGSLNTGSSFSLLPLDSLGGQSLMQSFFVMAFGYEYINGFDAILCFILSVAMVIEIAKKVDSPINSTILAVVSFVFWHPVYLNTSSIYSSSVLILGLIYCYIFFIKDYQPNPTTNKSIKVLSVPAFFIAAIITLKSTIAIFIIIFFVVNFIVGLIHIAQKRAYIISNIVVAVMAALALTPWFAQYINKISTLIQSLLTNGYSTTFAFKKGSLGMLLTFNYLELFWGGWLYWFLLFSIFLGAVIFVSLYLTWKNRGSAKQKIYNLPLISLCIATLLFYFMSPLVLPWGYSIQQTVRHTVPGLLVTVAILPYLLHSISCLTTAQIRDKFIFSAIIPTAQVVLILFIGMFLVLFVDRLDKLDKHGSPLTSKHLSAKKDWFTNNLSLTSNDTIKEIKKAQATIPQDKKVLTWISTPFHLDFTRNKIETITTLNPLFINKASGDLESFTKHLKQRNIEYIFWQYGGFSTKDHKQFSQMAKHYHPKIRNEAKQGLILLKILSTLKNSSEILYINKSKKLVIFKIKTNI